MWLVTLGALCREQAAGQRMHLGPQPEERKGGRRMQKEGIVPGAPWKDAAGVQAGLGSRDEVVGLRDLRGPCHHLRPWRHSACCLERETEAQCGGCDLC